MLLKKIARESFGGIFLAFKHLSLDLNVREDSLKEC